MTLEGYEGFAQTGDSEVCRFDSVSMYFNGQGDGVLRELVYQYTRPNGDTITCAYDLSAAIDCALLGIGDDPSPLQMALKVREAMGRLGESSRLTHVRLGNEDCIIDCHSEPRRLPSSRDESEAHSARPSIRARAATTITAARALAKATTEDCDNAR